MGSGRFRHQVRLVTPSLTDDGEGGQAQTWDDTVGPLFFVNILPISADEQAVAAAIQVLKTHRVVMHHDARVSEDLRFYRVAPTGTALQILGVKDPDGRQRWLEVDCAEVV